MKFASAWGQDPAVSRDTQSISLDLGTTVVPMSTLVAKKTAVGEISPGEVLTYTIEVENFSQVDYATGGFTVHDDLPEGVTFVPGSTKYSTGERFISVPDATSGSPFQCDESGFASPAVLKRRGGVVLITYDVIVDDPVQAKIVNEASVSFPDQPLLELTATTAIVFAEDIQVENTVYVGDNGVEGCNRALEKQTAAPDTDCTYCFKVTNTGKVTLDSISLRNGDLGFGSLEVPNLNAGESATVVYKGKITEKLTNVVHATGNPVFANGEDIPGLNYVSDSDPSAVDIIPYDPSISIDNVVYSGQEPGKCSDGIETLVGVSGDQCTYCFVATNTGNTYLTNVRITNDLLDVITTSDVKTIAPGDSIEIALPSSIEKTVLNVAKVVGTPSTSAGQPIPSLQNVEDTDPSKVHMVVPNIAVQNTVYEGDDGDRGCEGATELQTGYSGTGVSFCFKVTNNGDTKLNKITLKNDDLGDDSGSWSVQDLEPGQSATVVVKSSISEDRVNTVHVTANPLSSDGQDLDGVEDVTDFDPSQLKVIQRNPSISIDNTVYLGLDADGGCEVNGVEKVTGTAGKACTYCFRVVNTGDTVLTNVLLTNDQLDIVTTRDIKTLAPGESMEVSFPSSIDASILNTASVVGTPATSSGDLIKGLDDVKDTDPSEVELVTPAVNVENTVYLGDSGPQVCADATESENGYPGTVVTYCFEVTNTGKTHLSNVVLENDELDFSDGTLTVPDLNPGETVIVVHKSTIERKLENTVQVSADPVFEDGTDIAGLENVIDSDPSSVSVIPYTPSILVENTVYLGDSADTGCDTASEDVGGMQNDTVTYCFLVRNTGNTRLTGVDLANKDLDYKADNIGDLAPGESKSVAVPRSITNTMTNIVVATGTPSALGGESLGLGDVFDSDPSQVFMAVPAAPQTPIESSTRSADRPNQGGGGGDPHFKTWKGEKYDYHGECDLVLVDNPDFANGLGLSIHIRTTRRGWMSYIERAALRIGSDVLEFENSIEWLFNGEPMDSNGKLAGYEIWRFPKALSVRLDNKIKAKIDFIARDNGMPYVRLDEADSDMFRGSLGMIGDWETGHMTARDGKTIISDPTLFAREWQVRPSDGNLFSTAREPQYPRQCLEPEKSFKGRLGATHMQEAAEKACTAWGDDKEDCIFDVMTSRDISAAEGLPMVG